jgi:hypothetical protein
MVHGLVASEKEAQKLLPALSKASHKGAVAYDLVSSLPSYYKYYIAGDTLAFDLRR